MLHSGGRKALRVVHDSAPIDEEATLQLMAPAPTEWSVARLLDTHVLEVVLERVPQGVDPFRKVVVAAARLVRRERDDVPQPELLRIRQTDGLGVVPMASNASRTSFIESRVARCSSRASRDDQGIETVPRRSAIRTSVCRSFHVTTLRPRPRYEPLSLPIVAAGDCFVRICSHTWKRYSTVAVHTVLEGDP